MRRNRCSHPVRSFRVVREKPQMTHRFHAAVHIFPRHHDRWAGGPDERASPLGERRVLYEEHLDLLRTVLSELGDDLPPLLATRNTQRQFGERGDAMCAQCAALHAGATSVQSHR